MKILLFGGTTEGRLLTERLATLPLDVNVCVATEYGRETLPPLPTQFKVISKRMDCAAMTELMQAGVTLVVDATHPYASEATATIHAAAKTADVPVLRLARRAGSTGGCRCFGTVAAAAKALCEPEGPVLLATGSKELAAYTVVPGFAERLYPRVLPTVEAIQNCLELGYAQSHIIAMQGPFSFELNKAMMEQLGIHILVTKDGGPEGGFEDKLEAARAVGAEVFLVRRPPEKPGQSLEEIVAYITQYLEVNA